MNDPLPRPLSRYATITIEIDGIISGRCRVPTFVDSYIKERVILNHIRARAAIANEVGKNCISDKNYLLLPVASTHAHARDKRLV